MSRDNISNHEFELNSQDMFCLVSAGVLCGLGGGASVGVLLSPTPYLPLWLKVIFTGTAAITGAAVGVFSASCLSVITKHCRDKYGLSESQPLINDRSSNGLSSDRSSIISDSVPASPRAPTIFSPISRFPGSRSELLDPYDSSSPDGSFGVPERSVLFRDKPC